jgi:hypothetical protein
MSDIVTGLRTYLLTKSDVTDLVDARIFPGALPQLDPVTELPPEPPMIVLIDISGESIEHLTGGSGVRTTRVQVDCYATTHMAANNLREQVRANTPISTAAMGDETIEDMSHEAFYTRTEPDTAGSDNPWHVHSIDFMISHTEAVPA